MKKSILTVAVIAILFAACGNNTSNEHSHDGEASHQHTKGTHTHEDGSVHEDHAEGEHHQEEFKVELDSAALQKENEHGHSHDDGSHKH